MNPKQLVVFAVGASNDSEEVRENLTDEFLSENDIEKDGQVHRKKREQDTAGTGDGKIICRFL